MRLGIDFETSGLWRDSLPPSHSSQPSIIQLGAVLFDGRWRPVSKFVALIKPDGWSIEPEAEAHHGIPQARCDKYGIPIVLALANLKALAGASLQMFAHNARFERDVAESQLLRLGSDPAWWRRKTMNLLCTMDLSTRPCAIPAEKYNGFKAPTLNEALRHFYPQTDHDTRHEAESDIMDAALIAQALEGLGLLPAPFRPGFEI